MSKEEYKLFISTNEYSLGLISNKCKDDACVVPKKYDLENSLTYRSVADSESTKTEVVEVFDDQHLLLQDAYFHGTPGKEDFTLTLKEFNRATTLNGLNFLNISEYNGNTL